VVIYTGDKDLLQLVDKNVEIWRPILGSTRKIEIHNCDNFKNLNDDFEPYQLKELKGLIGDRSDNIPGIIDLDNKVAKKLIRKYKTIDGIYENLDNINKDVRKILVKKEKIARISLEVGTISRTKTQKV
jgi:DNA polymerase-1